jgi:hypothetical protein
MALLTWSPAQLRKLNKQYPVCPDVRALSKSIGKPYTAVKSKATVLKLKRTFTVWPPEADEKMREFYPVKSASEVAKMLGKTESSVIARAFTLSLKKTAEFKTERGRYGRSLQGPNPNKGNKNFRIPGGEKTQFKKGGISINTLWDGAIVTRVYHRNQRAYKWIRLNSVWYMLHVIRWKEVYGPVIPKDHIIVFKDGDTLNCKPENLECISLADNMKRNTIHQMPPELKEIVYLTTRINRKIKKIQKDGKE